MAKSFLYDDIGLIGATVQAGTFAGTTFTATPGPDNPERANDQSIGTGVGGTNDFDAADAIRFDLGSGVTKASGGALAVYVTDTPGATVDIQLHAAVSSATAMGAAITLDPVGTASLVSGWNIYSFTPPSASRYWFFAVATASMAELLSEIVIGTKYNFPLNFDLNSKLGDISGSDISTSFGGNEFSNKRHGQKATWNWNWGNIPATMKTSLDTMKTAVEIDRLKFIYDDETTKHWVRMSQGSLDFTEVAFNRFSTSVNLREQLQ